MKRPAAPVPRRPLRVRITLTLIVAAAIGGLVWVATAPQSTDTPTLPAAVEAVSPQGGDLDLRQATIAADLGPGYTGYLLYDGVEIPDDDLQHVDALNQVILKPKPESDYRVLSPGNHCVTVVYRKFVDPPDITDSYRWCFTLH